MVSANGHPALHLQPNESCCLTDSKNKGRGSTGVHLFCLDMQVFCLSGHQAVTTKRTKRRRQERPDARAAPSSSAQVLCVTCTARDPSCYQQHICGGISSLKTGLESFLGRTFCMVHSKAAKGSARPLQCK
eukprot:scaffold4359_cov18-Tisochrysis_lutea.AAC.1